MAGERWTALLLSLLLACDDESLRAELATSGSAAPAASGSMTQSAPDAGGELCPGPGCSVLALLPGLDPADPFRQRLVLHGDSSAEPRFRSDPQCASLGPDVAYDLDLRAFAEPVRVYVGVQAGFDGSVRIERGPEADPSSVACNEDHVPGVNNAFLALTLPPERYRVIADGERPEDAGAFELTIELPSRNGACWQPPANDRCEHAIPVDLTAGPQVFVGTTECASDQADPPWECGSFIDRRGEVLYALDLTERTGPVRLHATTDIEPKGDEAILFLVRDAGACAESLICNGLGPELWARLEPGRYFLAVEGPALLGLEGPPGTGVDFGLQISVDPEPCVASNDTCRTAEDIAPTLGRQSFTVWPMCGDDTLRTGCNPTVPNPDIFYRLDLSQFQDRVHVRAQTDSGGLVLMASAGDTCGAELWCGDFDLWLEPAVYYLAFDVGRDEQGPVQLELELDTSAPPPPVACIGESLAQCAGEHGCCAGDDTECWLVYLSCGLARDALDCLCAAEPACCDGRGDSTECATVLRDCGTFCPDFDPLVSCPEE